MSYEIEKGSLVDVIGLEYQNYNLPLRQATVVKDNDDGTFDVRLLSKEKRLSPKYKLNGFMTLKSVHLQDLQSAILY